MNRTVVTKRDIQKVKNRIINSKGTRASFSDSITDLDIFQESDIPSPEMNPQEVDKLVKKYYQDPDGYVTRLLKYVPSETIVLYLTLDPIVRPSEPWMQPDQQLLHWIVFLFVLVLTFLYLRRVQKVKKISQILISTLAFAVWVFAIGGPFVYLNWYEPLYGGILLPAYTALIPVIEA